MLHLKVVKLSKIQKQNISQFSITIAAAWYVGGLVTPFLSSNFEVGYFIRVGILAIMNTVGFLMISWRIHKL